MFTSASGTYSNCCRRHVCRRRNYRACIISASLGKITETGLLPDLCNPGMACCQAIVAGIVSIGNDATLKAAVFFIFFYYLWYTLGLFGIPFFYTSEIAPIHLRAAVYGVSAAISWLFNYLVTQVTPVAFRNMGYRNIVVYAVINAAVLTVVYFFYPETAGRSLEAKRLPKKLLAEPLLE